MALTERTVEDKIEIVGDFKHIQVRTATVIERDGVEIAAHSAAMSLHLTMTSQVKAQRCKPSVQPYTHKRLRMLTPPI